MTNTRTRCEKILDVSQGQSALALIEESLCFASRHANRQRGSDVTGRFKHIIRSVI